MFKISLIDIAGDGMLVEAKVDVDTLPDAECMARDKISKHLHIREIFLIHDDDLVYEVYANGHIIGAVRIETL